MAFGSLQQYAPLRKNEDDGYLDPDSKSTLSQDESVEWKVDSTNTKPWYRHMGLGFPYVIVQLILLLAAASISFLLGYMLRPSPLAASSSWSMFNFELLKQLADYMAV